MHVTNIRMYLMTHHHAPGCSGLTVRKQSGDKFVPRFHDRYEGEKYGSIVCITVRSLPDGLSQIGYRRQDHSADFSVRAVVSILGCRWLRSDRLFDNLLHCVFDFLAFFQNMISGKRWYQDFFRYFRFPVRTGGSPLSVDFFAHCSNDFPFKNLYRA